MQTARGRRGLLLNNARYCTSQRTLHDSKTYRRGRLLNIFEKSAEHKLKCTYELIFNS